MRHKNDAADAPDDKPGLKDRMSHLMLKPAVAQAAAEPDRQLTVDELKDTYLYADDKERAIGLIVAPVAALIGFIIINHLISIDPRYLANGRINPKYTSTSIYEELLAVMAVLSVLMLAFAWFRKRMYLGMVIALYSVTVFNLHSFWEFAFPFVMVAAWYLVRSYRFSRELKGLGISPRTITRKNRGEDEPVIPEPRYDAKRFTPHASPRRRTSAVGR